MFRFRYNFYKLWLQSRTGWDNSGKIWRLFPRPWSAASKPIDPMWQDSTTPPRHFDWSTRIQGCKARICGGLHLAIVSVLLRTPALYSLELRVKVELGGWRFQDSMQACLGSSGVTGGDKNNPEIPFPSIAWPFMRPYIAAYSLLQVVYMYSVVYESV